jgi:hypothetical protein
MVSFEVRRQKPTFNNRPIVRLCETFALNHVYKKKEKEEDVQRLNRNIKKEEWV